MARIRLAALTLGLVATMLAPSPARAQIGMIEGLFKNLTRIGGYWDYGGFMPASAVMTAGKPSRAPRQAGVQGPGIEFSFSIGSAGKDAKHEGAPAWAFELGLAYSYLFGFHAVDTTFELRGMLRELPRISWYALWRPERVVSPYFGLHMGLAQLQSVSIYDSTGAVFPISGSTWELGTSIGVATALTTGNTGLTPFIEAGYTLRNIQNLDWGGGVRSIPDRFPRTLRFSGWTLTLGLEFNIPKK